MSSSNLLERVVDLIERAQNVHFVIPDDTGRFSIEKDLIGKVTEVLDATAEFLREAMDYYELVSQGELEEERAESDGLEAIGAQIASELAAQEISGLAFVARSQLLDMGEILERAIESGEIWKIASDADTALRRTSRALIAVESAIREYEGEPPMNRQWKSLEDSIETRRLYSQFRRSILGADEPTDEELKSRLRSAGLRIARLRDLEIYPFLRIDDRLQIRQLQKRIAGWLVGEGESGPEAGRRLWEDLVSFARLLGQINNRQELREHDRRIVAELCHRLYESGPIPGSLPPHESKRFEHLLGRDEELDEMILASEPIAPGELREPLERLRRHFEKPFRPSLDANSTLVG